LENIKSNISYVFTARC